MGRVLAAFWCIKVNGVLGGQGAHQIKRIMDDFLNLYGLDRKRHLARLDTGQVKYFVDQAEQMAAAANDLFHLALGAFGQGLTAVLQQLGKAQDGVQRCTQFVAHG